MPSHDPTAPHPAPRSDCSEPGRAARRGRAALSAVTPASRGAPLLPVPGAMLPVPPRSTAGPDLAAGGPTPRSPLAAAPPPRSPPPPPPVLKAPRGRAGPVGSRERSTGGGGAAGGEAAVRDALPPPWGRRAAPLARE